MFKNLYIAICLMAISSVGSLATQNSSATETIKKTAKKIIGEGGTLLGFRGNVIDRISTSIYNYYIKHNTGESKNYHGNFYIYGGRKFKITKNVYLDVYYSFIKLSAFYIIDINICDNAGGIFALAAFITININIHIYKDFYLSIAPIHWILYRIANLVVAASYYYQHQKA